MNSRPVVLLYNPLSGHGHLDSWLAMFTRVLLARGFVVQVLTPNPKTLRAQLAQHGSNGGPAPEILDWEALMAVMARRSALNQFVNKWRSVAEGYYFRIPASRPSPEMSLPRRLKKRLLQLALPPLFRVLQPLLPFLKAGDYIRSCAGEDAATTLDPAEAGQRIAAALEQSPSPAPDFVLHMYMDMYSLSEERWQLYAGICPFPWGGVRFSPATPDTLEPYCTLPALRGMCLLDERECAAYSAALPDKRFSLLPDTTFAALPDVEPHLVQTIRSRAKGRRIVFLGGSIGGQKNLARWEELIRKADPSRWFFVMVGEVHRSTLSEADCAALHALETSPPENYFAHAEFLEDEREFNALIAASSLIFAVYRRFTLSSNMPGKAAYLERPILSAQGFLMGDRVARYGIGRTVPEDDVDAMLAALEDLAVTPVPSERFAAYRADFSEQRLGEALAQFITQSVGSP